MDLPLEVDHAQAVADHFKDSLYQDLAPADSEALFGLMQDYTARLKANTITREESVERMRKANPRFILRNYLLHQAIEQLENGQDELFQKLQEAMREPYSNKFDEFLVKRPAWASQKAGCSMLSCSS
jgi:uncharacterized protein YdiU (UPF0061 family)